MKQTDIGIFLHRIAYSESSIIATFYTQKNGIQKFLFQGAKKKNHNLFPLNICEITYYFRKDSELVKLTHVENTSPLNNLRNNPMKGVIVFFLADVLKQTLQTNEQEKELFQFITQQIAALETAKDVSDFPVRFLAAYTQYNGIFPHQQDEVVNYFNLQEGFFHEHEQAGEWCIKGNEAQQLYNVFFHQKIDKSGRKKALETLLMYYQIHIPRFNVEKSIDIIRAILS